jgi:hypothetical protein
MSASRWFPARRRPPRRTATRTPNRPPIAGGQTEPDKLAASTPNQPTKRVTTRACLPMPTRYRPDARRAVEHRYVDGNGPGRAPSSPWARRASPTIRPGLPRLPSNKYPSGRGKPYTRHGAPQPLVSQSPSSLLGAGNSLCTAPRNADRAHGGSPCRSTPPPTACSGPRRSSASTAAHLAGQDRPAAGPVWRQRTDRLGRT